MDILIKNLRLPREYEQVNITILSDGSVIEHFRNESGKWSSYRSGGLKAIELPPHGDLCDKTFLNTMIENADWSDKEALADYIIDLVYDAEVIVEGNDGTDN